MNIDIYGNLMTAMAILLASAVVSPIVAGTKRKLAGWINFALVATAAILLLYTCYAVIFEAAPQESKIITLGAFGIYFLMDSFSAFFVAIVSFMAVISSLYSIEYMEHYHDYSLRGFYFNLPIFVLGMIVLLTVDDLSIGFTIAWQLMTIASYFLIRFESREKGVVRSANKYLILMELAWLLIIGGTMLIPGVTMGDSIGHITEKFSVVRGAHVYVVYGLLLVGFGLKSGVFPFGQLWLPDAHSVAPSPISALLSGVMIKTGVYGIIRTLFWIVPEGNGFVFNGKFWGALVATFGVVSLFIGTTQALKQHDAKRLHAYHSIGQMGYIVLGIGSALFMLSCPNPFLQVLAAIAMIGAIYHTLNHTVFKGLLFLSTGSVQYATGLKDLNKLGGLIKFMPATTVIAGIAAFSIAGIPAFSGFMSKWSIISADILGGTEVGFLVIFGIIALMTSAITLASYVKFFGMTFTSTGHEWNTKKEVKEVPVLMLFPKFILAALCIIQGLLPFLYFETIISIFKNSGHSIVTNLFRGMQVNNSIVESAMGVQINLPGAGISVSSIAVPAMLLAVFAIAFVIAYLFKKSAGSVERTAPVWMCGYQELNETTRYKASSMYHAFKHFMWWTGGNVK